MAVLVGPLEKARGLGTFEAFDELRGGAFGKRQCGDAGGITSEEARVGFEDLRASNDTAGVGRKRSGIQLLVTLEDERTEGQAA